MKKGRNWFGTLNNPDAWMPVEDWQYLKCAVWQLEIGESGTVHYQMALGFTENVSSVWAHKLEGLERASLFPMVDVLGSVAYCSKAEGRLEGPYYYPSKAACDKWAAGGNQGKRNDLDSLARRVINGASDHELSLTVPGQLLRYSAHIDSLRLKFPKKSRNSNKIDAVVYLGPTGTGKSYRLRQECPEGAKWFWANKGKWWDGYAGQPGIVFDEFTDAWMSYGDAKRLFDGGPMRVERKGGMLNMLATSFRFSANNHPRNWWRHRPGKVPWEQDPLRRRLRHIVLMEEPFVVPEDMVIDEAEHWVDPLDSVPLRKDEAGVLWNGRDYD